MAVGSSGRIVIEMDPELKAQLYEALRADQTNLKEWFLRHVDSYLTERVQLSLEFERKELSRRTA